MHDFQMLHTHAHMHSALSVVDQSQLQDINVYIYTYTDHFQNMLNNSYYRSTDKSAISIARYNII